MPILIEEEKRSIPWFAITMTLVVIGGLSAGTYYLFFAPTPGIDVVLPAALTSATKISAIEIDPSTVINSKAFRSLRVYSGLPSTGDLGKNNPFAQ